jgi:outer membrane protein, heavy metal efflux system
MRSKDREFMLSRSIKILILGAAMLLSVAAAWGQVAPTPTRTSSFERYIDQVNGMTADAAVAFAIDNNPEIEAMRKEAKAGESLIAQARLRPNPSVEVSGSKQIGGDDNSFMVEGGIPLELGGRRGARIRVAERELEIRQLAVAERERQIAAEVRLQFGESLAAVLKLRFIEEMLAAATENYNLVAAQVEEGRRAPLERNMEAVELNRILAMREMAEGDAEIGLIDLRNLLGMQPDVPLKIRGDFDSLIVQLPPQADAVRNALQLRTDLAGARAVERLAAARTDQARAEGRIDADAMIGYQRMRSGFPLSGFNDMGILMPIMDRMNFFTFGVRLNLPVRNRNQGMIAASILEEEAAAKRREFGELAVRRDVATAYAKYNRAARAEEIYRVGVREQAAQNLDVVRQTYELGSKTLLDYIAELRRFIDTEIGFIESQKEAYLARIEVLRAVNSAELINK